MISTAGFSLASEGSDAIVPFVGTLESAIAGWQRAALSVREHTEGEREGPGDGGVLSRCARGHRARHMQTVAVRVFQTQVLLGNRGYTTQNGGCREWKVLGPLHRKGPVYQRHGEGRCR